jgi:hypothetical protein
LETVALRNLISLSLTLTLVVACVPVPPKRPTFNHQSDKPGTAEVNPEPSTGKPDPEKSDPEITKPEKAEPEPSDGKATNPKDGSGDKPEIKVPEVKAPEIFDVVIEKIEAKNPGGQAAIKGETAVFKLNLKNPGTKSGIVRFTPYLSAKNFTDYSNIKLPSFDVSLKASESKTAEFKIQPFFKEEGGNREYALNKGDYILRFQAEGNIQKEFKEFVGKDFRVAGSRAVFTAIHWSQAYLDKARYTKGINEWLRESFTRRGQTSDGGNLFASYDGGFDQMMNIKTMWKTFPNWNPDFKLIDSLNDQNKGTEIVYLVSAESQKRLGLKQQFQQIFGQMTHPDNHGYDMEMGLTAHGLGGIALIGANSNISGIFDSDTSIGRSQMILIHETGHNYGAPHCDPIQGFVMCSGEKHDHYTNGDGWFVWHDVSIKDMKKAQNMEKFSFGYAAFDADPAIMKSTIELPFIKN